jgi:hypothetical protein
LLPGQSIFDVPEDSSAQIDVVFHQSHSRVSRPAFLVVVADDVLVVRVGMFGQVTLNQISSFFGRESEENVNSIDVSGEKSNRVRNFGVNVLK